MILRSRASTMTHTQTEPLKVWEIDHHFATIPSVTVAIDIGGVLETILPVSVKHETNKVFIEFSRPRAGKVSLS